MVAYENIAAIEEETGNINVVIETPKGNRNKYKFDEEKKVFKLSKLLPGGMIFPYDFGFIPSTLAQDGDPLDILLLMEEPVFSGCLVETRLLGVIEADQKPKGEKWRRNDRLIGLFAKSRDHESCRGLSDLEENVLTDIESFFVNYHKVLGNIFKPIGREGVAAAKQLLQKSMHCFEKEKGK